MSDNRYISYDIADALIERPIGFSVGHRHFSLYPLSIGKIQLISRLCEIIGLVSEDNTMSLYDVLKAAKEHKEECLRIIVYATLNGNECLDETLVAKRRKKLKNLKIEDIACLVLQILTQDKTAEILSYYKIDKEKARMDKVVKAKNTSSNSVTFGGQSIWGTLIDFVCERYGWTFHYVIWDISYANLQMLAADHVKNLFLTEEEKKKAHISTDGVVINADNANSLKDYIRTQSWK